MDSPSLPTRLQADLLTARKARDEAAVTALRTALAALANAEAPPAPPTPAATPPANGLVEHSRLVLTPGDHQRILGEQIASRVEAAAEYDTIGQGDAGDRLRAEITVLRRYIT